MVVPLSALLKFISLSRFKALVVSVLARVNWEESLLLKVHPGHP